MAFASPNGILKRWQRSLLDIKTAVPAPIKAAASSPRLLARRTWLIVLFVLLLLFAIIRSLGHSHDSDIVHLDHLVQKVERGRTSGPEAPAAEQNVLHTDSTGATGDKSIQSEDENEDEDDILEALLAGEDQDEDEGDDQEAEAYVRKDQYGRDIPDYREIFSVSSRDRKYYLIWWDGEKAYNANLIPHPTQADQWIVMAQKEQYDDPHMGSSSEIVCSASFFMGFLTCVAHPTEVPVAPSIVGNCQGDLAYANLRVGPRDGRLFMGPQEPYIMYGSQSKYACFGLWLQDARMILEPFRLESRRVGLFRDAMELRRPEPWHVMEKNFFLFWDDRGVAYVHHDIWPNRVFARLDYDGVVGPDLGPIAAGNDARCMASFMPAVRNLQESIHQTTNSLAITLCKRTDPRCVPTDDNTYIMHIFHWKSYYEFHGVYEPYVVLFKRSAPFSLYAISQRPFWIHGRTTLTEASGSVQYRHKSADIPPGHTEFFYITSMSWKRHGSRYHGYIDDVVFLAFGIEDAKSGAIDVTAGDLLQDLAFCELSLPDE